MGDRSAPRTPMAWQASLAEMLHHGTLLVLTCENPTCKEWIVQDVEALARKHGGDWTAWDRRPPCPICGGPAHYMASPGPSTPFRPLITGPAGELAHKQYLATFGLTRRDVRRIQAFAERVTTTWPPTPLTDLDVPYAVTARMESREPPAPFKLLGAWAGRQLLVRDLNVGERGLWEQRPKGPRAL